MPWIQRRRLWVTLLLAALLLPACGGDDDDDAPTDPGDGVANELFNAAVFCELSQAVEQAVGLLFTGGGSVPGDGGGRIVVQGGNFTFEDYSPDGAFVLDGNVVLDLLASPTTVKGGFDWRNGAEEGRIDVDMTVTGTVQPITYGGTLTFDGQVVELSTVEMPDCSDR